MGEWKSQSGSMVECVHIGLVWLCVCASLSWCLKQVEPVIIMAIVSCTSTLSIDCIVCVCVRHSTSLHACMYLCMSGWLDSGHAPKNSILDLSCSLYWHIRRCIRQHRRQLTYTHTYTHTHSNILLHWTLASSMWVRHITIIIRIRFWMGTMLNAIVRFTVSIL